MCAFAVFCFLVGFAIGFYGGFLVGREMKGKP